MLRECVPQAKYNPPHFDGYDVGNHGGNIGKSLIDLFRNSGANTSELIRSKQNNISYSKYI